MHYEWRLYSISRFDCLVRPLSPQGINTLRDILFIGDCQPDEKETRCPIPEPGTTKNLKEVLVFPVQTMSVFNDVIGRSMRAFLPFKMIDSRYGDERGIRV